MLSQQLSGGLLAAKLGCSAAAPGTPPLTVRTGDQSYRRRIRRVS